MLSIFRTKTSNFIDIFKDEINFYLKSAIKQTVIEYISNIDDANESNLLGSPLNEDDSSSSRLVDRVRLLKIQEFLNMIWKVLNNVKIMIRRVEVKYHNNI